MKKRIINIAGFVITIILTVFVLQCVGWLLDPFESRDGFDAIHAFHSLKEDSLDVIVYGSSHAWKGCDTRVMRDKYNISAYNYGCHWQAINTTELFFKDSLRTQSPKIVCIDTFYVNSVLIDTDMTGQIYYTKAIEWFDGKWEYLKQCFGNDIERYASYLFPIIMFHDNWNKISYENFLEQDHERFVESMGYYQDDTVYPCSLPDFNEFEQHELNENAIQTLDEIVRICNEKDITVILYTCPWEGEFNFSNALKAYSKKNNVVYLDLFQHYEDIGLNGETDLRDAGHLNNSGAAKVADYLGKYITQNYDL